MCWCRSGQGGSWRPRRAECESRRSGQRQAQAWAAPPQTPARSACPAAQDVYAPSHRRRTCREAKRWREEALTNLAHPRPPPARGQALVLNQALLPTRRRRAGGWFNQIMPAHPQKAPVERTILAQKDRVHCRLHVVVNAPRARAAEEPEGAVMRVEHHLLARARIGASAPFLSPETFTSISWRARADRHAQNGSAPSLDDSISWRARPRIGALEITSIWVS